MEKQVHFENELERQKQDKFNKITTFLGKFIFGQNFDMLKKVGLIDCYTSDPQIMEILQLNENQRFLFILFKNKKLNLEEIKKVVTALSTVPVDVVFSYELVNDYSMVVLDFPVEFVPDYDHIVNGKYSKLSDQFKVVFPETREVFNEKKQRLGKEYTLYYHIFNKTEWLKNFWMERLGLVELDEKLELWSPPTQKEDLIFDVNNILNKK